ncbi:hypothetical protein [Nitrosomonas marina]|uniref:Lipoprotein n=1 Tax=Nitrosomonas marina TaxID=917 RepID=A0A1H8HMF4_9PROT|nr:hypothetical protein [Nitrosomonas marina]SEN57390.1 hypothetical protein SAMN05216325_1252 [Nitrosomonas marina]
MKTLLTAKPYLPLVLFVILFLAACNRISPVQHHYSTNVGCVIANDLYAVYFSAYVAPENNSSDPAKVDESLYTSYCGSIPRTGSVFFTADLIDEDLREMPISLRLVEQEPTGDSNTPDYSDGHVLSKVNPRIYSQGTIEAQAFIDKKGHYALYLIVGEEAVFEDDILKIPFTVGMETAAQPIRYYVIKVTTLLMTFAFPAFILLLIMLPMFPKLRLMALSKILSNAQNR